MKKNLLSLLLGVPLLLSAQNPVIRDQFTADPTARVFNNKVYLYPSHDIKPPVGQRADWFCMEDYHVFSSENLTDWTDHGVIVTQNKVPWVRPDSYSMWAPDCVERNGKYYFYFPSTPAGAMRGFGVGVAIADSPEGPFIPEPEPIKGINGIDPCVLLASDGNAYIFWGNGRCAKLKDNMKEIADDTPTENCLKDLPNRQAEGPFAFEYNGNYYLTYPYVRENTEVLGYADVTTQLIDTVNTFRSYSASLPVKGSWLRYNDIDCSSLTDAYLLVSAKAAGNTAFYVREKTATGRIVAKFDMTVISEGGFFRRDMSNQWLTLTAPLEYPLKGVTDLVITCEGDAGVDVDWVQFKNRPKYFSAVTTPSAQPDEDGFIRRWLILKPLDKPNSGNTVFTDSYLREHFAMEYFKGQQTIVPRDGQKVKAQKQTLTWHALDSENYNVKLFRFAEKWGQQVYGVLFWTVTIIDCDEDIENVRLAVGSNSASMWWLNGDEALLLSGDRRMVKDDAMSHCLTLKKGRNILRGAVINGPGMSDFCVRFLDEKANPVTNYSIKAQ